MTDVLNTDGTVVGAQLKQSLDQEISKDIVAARLRGGVMVVDHNFTLCFPTCWAVCLLLNSMKY